jgi:hypothetical protein
MQMSGTCPPLSDGVKKTITTTVPVVATKSKPMANVPAPKVNTHRAGGFAKHQKGGR